MSMRRSRWQLVVGSVVGIATFSSLATAREVVSCRMPNGSVHIVASPPEGCVVMEPFKLRRPPRSSPTLVKEAVVAPPPAPPAKPWPPRIESPPEAPPELAALTGEDLTRFLDQATKDRQAIEGRAEEVGKRLEQHREYVAALEPISPDTYEKSPVGWGAYVETVRKRADELEQLRQVELGILRDLDRVKDEFAILSSRVSAAHGGQLPDAWEPQMRCEACPRS